MMDRLVQREVGGAARDGAIDLPKLARAVIRKKMWILHSDAAGFAVALAFVTFLPAPLHRRSPRCCSKTARAITRGRTRRGPTAPTLDAEAVESQAETVTSPDVARKAIASSARGQAGIHRRSANLIRRRSTATATRTPRSARLETFPSGSTASADRRRACCRSNSPPIDRARGARRQHGRRGLPGVAGKRQEGRGEGGERLALRARSTSCAARSPRPT